MEKEIIGKFFEQNCGDILEVLEKTNQKRGTKYLFRCKFIKYPYEIFCLKGNILNGSVNNPQIEQVEFIEKFWPQNCGDTLKIISKSEKKQNGGYLFKCIFQKYPYEIFAKKENIKKGQVINPRIEEENFIGKKFLQNCGDTLLVLEKTKKVTKAGIALYLCKFLNYEKYIETTKKQILLGTVENTKIEEEIFINKIFLQKCGDSLKVLRKTDNKIHSATLFECEFLKYPCKILAKKQNILMGEVDNPNFPWRTKEGFLNIITSFREKPTIVELSKKINKSPQLISQLLKRYSLQEYIKYFPTESNYEKEIRNYCISLNRFTENKGNFELLDNKYEIDIYISNKSLGIEYNGSYWHSELFKERNYHQEKSLLAQEKGIHLIHIWEWEWNEKQEVIKSLIKSKLGIFDRKVGASKCKIKELDYKTYAVFCNENHLQGECGAKVKLGLFYKEELVQIMSFGVPRFTSNYQWEIIRECSKLGYCIIGGKEKLWSYFVKNYSPSSVISYCDFSKFTGESYLKLGFRKERLNKPGFMWWDNKLGIYYLRTPYKHQFYEKEGYLKIYDAGQLVFVWNNF